MEFNSLKGGKSGTRRQRAELPVNLAVRLENIEIGQGTPSFFNGFTVGDNQPVKVRMMTIEEGIAVNRRKDEPIEKVKERLQASYAGTGEKHRPRPAEIGNSSHKTHCQQGGLLMFTKCLKNDDGTYRAHWVETLEREAGAGCDRVMANVRIDEIKDPATKAVKGVSVVTDVVYPQDAVILNKDNIRQALLTAFSNGSEEEKRKPFAFFRIVDPETGKMPLDPARANAKYDEVQVSDPDSGAEFKVYQAASAEDSINNLLGNKEKWTTDAAVVRAALWALSNKAEGEPEFKGMDASTVDDLRKLTAAVRDGALVVEMVPGERIGAGPASRASIEKAARTNANHPVNTMYTSRDDQGRIKARRFTETFLTTRVGKDGHRYFTKAVTAEAFPHMQVIGNLATTNDHKATAEAAQARAASGAEVLVDDDHPLEAGALDQVPADELAGALEHSANGLEAEIY